MDRSRIQLARYKPLTKRPTELSTNVFFVDIVIVLLFFSFHDLSNIASIISIIQQKYLFTSCINTVA